MGGSGAWHPGRLQPHAPSKEVGGAAPLCIAPCVCIKASSGRPIGHPGNVVPKGHPPFSGRVFRACAQPGTGPVLRPLRHASQHIMPESGRTPGPPTVPGSFFGHCGIFFGCFPPSETPSTILHRKQQNMQVPHLSWFTFGGCLHGAAHDKFEGNHVVAWEGPHARLS